MAKDIVIAAMAQSLTYIITIYTVVNIAGVFKNFQIADFVYHLLCTCIPCNMDFFSLQYNIL